MSYFDRDYYPRRGNFWSWLGGAVLGAILGGLMVLYFAPSIIGNGQNPLPPQLAQPPASERQGPLPTLPQFSGDESPVIAIYRQVGPAVVGITNYSGRSFYSNAPSSGSGVIIDSQRGYIATNNHVIEGAQRLEVIVDQDQVYEAKIVGADPQTDLAVLQIEAQNLPEARLGDSAKVQVGEMVVAIGNPLGAEFARSVTAGVVSALNRSVTIGSPGRETTLNLIQTDAAINPGNSGGALINAAGEVIGINSAKIASADVEGMGFAIPINDARPILAQLVEKGYVSRPFIGIRDFVEINEEASRWYGIPQGIHVGEVIPGSPAARAGMKNGDVIVAMDGQKILTYDDLQKFLNSHQVGDEVKVQVERQDAGRLELSLTLGEMPRT